MIVGPELGARGDGTLRASPTWPVVEAAHHHLELVGACLEGDAVQLSLRVANRGGADAPATTIEVATTVDGSPKVLATRALPGIDAGTTLDGLVWTVPVDPAHDEVRVRIVDAEVACGPSQVAVRWQRP